ncbi:hypothetical protein BZA77DRAFT_290335 [Pyronema omphalodes]|nr:hypothetical protein BZA77DRAFT_290335 [Pyronema omphalodes]
MAGTAPTNMKPRKRHRLRRGISNLFKLLKAPKNQPSMKTKGKNTESPETDNTNPATSPSSKISAPTAESSSKAESRAAIGKESPQSDSSNQFEQLPTTTKAQPETNTNAGNTDERQTNSTATTTVTNQSLWSKALSSKVLDDERETLNSLNSQANSFDTVSEVKSFVQNILSIKKDDAWKIRVKGEEIVLRDIARKLLGWMDRFKEIGDIIIQYSPVNAALPWAGFRFLLKVYMDNEKTMDAVFVGLEYIAGLIHRCTLYELLYISENSCHSKNLEESMLQLYIAILKFLAKAIIKSKQNLFKTVFTTEDISNNLKNVENLEKRVGYDADVAKEQTLHNQPQLHNIKDWLEDSEASTILHWISLIPYTSHHKRISEGRLEGTAGAGKTYIM